MDEGMRITKKQREQGREIIEAAVNQDRRWTTADILETFGLKESQVQAVKKAARQCAAEEFGQTWSWHPQTNCFRLVPAGDTTLARQITGYAAQHAADCIQHVIDVTATLHTQGFYTEKKYRRADRAWSDVRLVAREADSLLLSE